MEVTYPLIAKLAGGLKGLSDEVQEAVESIQGVDETISEENHAFIDGYIDVVFQFVVKYLPGAQTSNDETLTGELKGLYEGGKAVKKIMQDITIVQEEDDEGDNGQE